MKFHPAGKIIIRISLLLVIAVNLIAWLYLGTPWSKILFTALSLVLLIPVLLFFRYPARFTDPAERLVLSPADGTICAIEEYEEKQFLKTKTLKVSVFMSPFNVHINWVPVAGQVSHLEHRKGKFHAAFKSKSAEENERFSTVIRIADGRKILTNQIAGAMARRILNFLSPGQEVNHNMEMGFIRFGSRVDLYLPADTSLRVALGEKVTGNRTVIGELS
ncbi:MAG: phosphatidylserine decarboxylase family protein [Mangrovibacterium sp.]